MNKSILIKSLLFFTVLWFLEVKLYSQTTLFNTALAPASFNNNNGSGLVTFNFENTNPYPIEIIEVSTVLRSTGASTFTIYYNTTPVSGPPGVIPGSPNWTVAATNAINSTIGAAANQTQEVVLTGFSLVIPPSTTYGIAIGGFNGATGTMGYYTIPATPATVTLSGAGCNMINGNNVSYGYTSPTITTGNHPRGFVGTLTFQPQVTIQNNAGVANLIAPVNDTFCSNMYKDIAVSIKNLGANPLDSVRVGWSIDGITQTPISYNTQLASYMDSAVVTLGSAFFPTTAPVQIRAWTYLPNGVTDADFTDDTLNTTAAALIEGVVLDIVPGDTTICNGHQIVLDGEAHPKNPIYVWSTAQLTQTITVSTSGTYWLKVQNSDGCFGYDTIHVNVHPDPVLGSIPIIDNGNGSFTFNVLGAANVDQHKWDFGNGTIIDWTNGMPTTQTMSFATGMYDVTLSVRNMCNEISIIRKINVEVLGLDHLKKLQSMFTVFPNPTTNFVTVENNAGINIENLIVANVLGQKINEYKNVDKQSFTVDLTKLPTGIYTFTIITDKGTITKKVDVVR